jgi:hypothetical protein
VRALGRFGRIALVVSNYRVLVVVRKRRPSGTRSSNLKTRSKTPPHAPARAAG